MKTQNYSKLAKELGKRGGDKTAERGADYYREIGRRGAAKRWGNRGTVPPKCAWCGEYGEVKLLKVTPKREKPACLRCHKMMTAHIDDIRKEFERSR